MTSKNILPNEVKAAKIAAAHGGGEKATKAKGGGAKLTGQSEGKQFRVLILDPKIRVVTDLEELRQYLLSVLAEKKMTRFKRPICEADKNALKGIADFSTTGKSWTIGVKRSSKGALRIHATEDHELPVQQEICTPRVLIDSSFDPEGEIGSIFIRKLVKRENPTLVVTKKFSQGDQKSWSEAVTFFESLFLAR